MGFTTAQGGAARVQFIKLKSHGVWFQIPTLEKNARVGLSSARIAKASRGSAALCLELLVRDANASGTMPVAETVVAKDSLSTLRDFANAWRDWAVSSRKRLNSASLVLSSPINAEGSGLESMKTGSSRAGMAAPHASRSDFAAITEPRNFPAGRCTGNPSSYSYRWTVRTAFPEVVRNVLPAAENSSSSFFHVQPPNARGSKFADILALISPVRVHEMLYARERRSGEFGGQFLKNHPILETCEYS